MRTIRYAIRMPMTDNPLAAVLGAASGFMEISTEAVVDDNEESARQAGEETQLMVCAFLDGMKEKAD